MKTPRNTCLIKADKHRETKVNFKGGLQLIMPEGVKKFNPYHSHTVTQDGVVAAAPNKLRTNDPIKIKNGDHIYGHHFMCIKEKKVVYDGQIYYANDHDSLYCRVDESGNVEMVGPWNFVVPIYTPINELISQSGLLLSNIQPEVANMGKIIYPSDELIEEGVKSGDIVMFRDNCEYEIAIEGKMFYRIRTKDIVGVIDGIPYQEHKEKHWSA